MKNKTINTICIVITTIAVIVNIFGVWKASSVLGWALLAVASLWLAILVLGRKNITD